MHGMNGVTVNHLRAIKLVCLGFFCLMFTSTNVRQAASLSLTPSESYWKPTTSWQLVGHLSRRAPAGADDNCVKCHEQSTGRAAEVVEIHLSSTHGKLSVGCDDCHGGDPAQTDEAKAHSINFVGKPDRNGTLTICGACHDQQLAQFKTSKHFPEKQGIPRLDCAECHGAHAVGNPPETFSIGQFCASCHGLEYLPALPQQFQDLLNLSDDLRDAFNRLEAKGRKPSDEAIKQRKDLRHQTAEIIHPADVKGGLARIPRILSKGEELKQQIKTNGGK